MTQETPQDTTKGVEGMAEKMEQCGCVAMMEKIKSFMPAMCCGPSDDGEDKADPDVETGAKAVTETDDQDDGTTGQR